MNLVACETPKTTTAWMLATRRRLDSNDEWIEECLVEEWGELSWLPLNEVKVSDWAIERTFRAQDKVRAD